MFPRGSYIVLEQIGIHGLLNKQGMYEIKKKV